MSHALILVPFIVSCVMSVLLHQSILNRPQPCNTVLDSEYVELGYLPKQWFSPGFGQPHVLEKGPMAFLTKMKKTCTSSQINLAARVTTKFYFKFQLNAFTVQLGVSLWKSLRSCALHPNLYQ